MSDILVAPPTVEPLSRTQAKAHLRVSGTDEDSLIDALIAAARGAVEESCARALVLQTRRAYLDGFEDCIELAVPPVRAVQSIVYVDADGARQTLSSSLYRVDRHSVLARITPAYDETWPATQGVTNAVEITYTTGHLVPFTANAGTDVLSATGHGFSDTDIAMVETIGGALPTGLSAATHYYVRDASADTLKLAATSGGTAIDITAAGTAPNVLGHLPQQIRQAMLLIIGHLYENREQVNVGGIVTEMPYAADRLLEPFRVRRF